MEFAEAISKPRVDGVRLRRQGSSGVSGSLAVTGHHLIFSAAEGTGVPADDELWLLHKAVDVVSVESRGSGTTTLTAKCKDLAVIAFDFASADDAAATARSVEILSNLADTALHYPFFYRAPWSVLEDGWTAYSAAGELARLQVVDDAVLAASAKYRDGGRFPVLAYFHKDTRPLVGPSGKRCREDEALLSALAGTSARGYILDTRPHAVAQTAKGKGGGTEVDQYYPMWKRMHKNLPRWQQLQDAYAKLVDACNDSGLSTDKWLSKVNSSGWLGGLAELLTAACVMAQSVDREDMSLVVHGAEGLDNTLALTSLVQILLDPDARTIRGFSAVIEREWVEGGHPFSRRCAHAAYAKGKETGPEEAPTFALFLHTVAAVLKQFETSFEFKENFLVLILDNAYASEFGTFLGANEQSKKELGVKERTVSLWSYVNRPEVLSTFLNAYYEPNPAPIWPSVAPQSIGLWERVVFRHTRDWSRQDSAEAQMEAWKVEELRLMTQVTRLRRHNSMKLVIFSDDGQIVHQSRDLPKDDALKADILLSLIGVSQFCAQNSAALSSVEYSGMSLTFGRISDESLHKFMLVSFARETTAVIQEAVAIVRHSFDIFTPRNGTKSQKHQVLILDQIMEFFSTSSGKIPISDVTFNKELTIDDSEVFGFYIQEYRPRLHHPILPKPFLRFYDLSLNAQECFYLMSTSLLNRNDFKSVVPFCVCLKSRTVSGEMSLKRLSDPCLMLVLLLKKY